jgi:hypothetical protein
MSGADTKTGVVLGTKLSGEAALPVVNGYALLDRERLCRHVLVCGATGSGKTETVLRLAWAVARGWGVPVFYLDAKGDRATAERFVGLMADAGRRARVFPLEPIDGWRGTPRELVGRLMEVVDYAREGPAAWYRDVARLVVGLACEQPGGPPRSARELLTRMELAALRYAHGDTTQVMALSAQQVDQVRLRYAAFFSAVGGALDGGWAWEEAEAAYLLLDGLRLREETACVARFLLEDFAHYFSSRKAPAQWALLIVDEFSALAYVAGLARCVEQARSFQTALVLVPQVTAGMGTQADAARILGNVETVICHRLNTPEEIVALAGTREVPHYSARYTRDGATGEGSMHKRTASRVDPNSVRALPRGEAYVISHGRALRARIPRVPLLRGELPMPVAVPVGNPDEADSQRGDRGAQRASDSQDTGAVRREADTRRAVDTDTQHDEQDRGTGAAQGAESERARSPVDRRRLPF